MSTAHLEQDRPPTKVLVLGASGMLGHTLMHELSRNPANDVSGTIRAKSSVPETMLRAFAGRLGIGVDLTDDADRKALLDRFAPDLVINAVGVIKQDPLVRDSVNTVRINALLPHALAGDCQRLGIRLIHVSTDCVFSGKHGRYSESDTPDPVDFYGRSKLLGEVGAPALTLRTSIIGHELNRHESLVDWFLSQPQTVVRGFRRAIYSGVTTVELARLIDEVLIPRPSLSGLYHVASEPITKFDLLKLIAEIYGWTGQIEPFDEFVCDRSMVADRLAEVGGYRPHAWRDMISEMFRTRSDWTSATPRSMKGTA